jgi:hypothetical protein
MSLIVAGRFQTFEQAEQAASKLFARSFREEDVSLFYVNPPGQHASYPIGGDVDVDRSMRPGQKGAGGGVVIGAVIGAAVGAGVVAAMHLSALIFVIASALGAYIGSLVGAMGMARHGKDDPPLPASHVEEQQPVREAGVLLAVHVTDESRRTAEDVLRESGAQDVERASGRWQEGRWIDFNPVAAPVTVSPTASSAQAMAPPVTSPTAHSR